MTTRRIGPSTTQLPFPKSADTYDHNYFLNLVGTLQRMLDRMNNPATLRGGTLNLSSVPANAYGAVVGDVYHDNGVLKIVRIGDMGALGSSISVSIGGVTVSTV